MSIWTPGNKKVNGIWVNHGGEKKEIVSAWTNVGGEKVKVYGKGGASSKSVFVTAKKDKIAYSYDGDVWVTLDVLQFVDSSSVVANYAGCQDVTYFNDCFVILYRYSYNLYCLLKSSDGIEWEEFYRFTRTESSNLSEQLFVVDDILYVCGNYGKVFYTSDLINFVETTFGRSGSSSVYINGIVKNPKLNRYYLLQNYGYSVTSTNPKIFGASYMSGPTLNNVKYSFRTNGFYDENDGFVYGPGGTSGVSYRTNGVSWSSTNLVSIYTAGSCKVGNKIISVYTTGAVFEKQGSDVVMLAGAITGSSVTFGTKIVHGNGRLVCWRGKMSFSKDGGTTWQESSVQPEMTIYPTKVAFSIHGGSDDAA